MSEYYIGQRFENTYPPEAALWCNSNNAYMDTISENPRIFEIKAVPEHIPTYEEVDMARIRYRERHIDDKTLARMRKQANGTWTEADEDAYIALDAEVTAYIESHFPYPVGE